MSSLKDPERLSSEERQELADVGENMLTGMAVGAAYGALIGSVVPGAGTLAGGLIGGGIGWVSGLLRPTGKKPT